MWVENGVVVAVGWESEEKERGDAQTCFSAARAVYVHYFKAIRQRVLQSDRVMLFRGSR